MARRKKLVNPVNSVPADLAPKTKKRSRKTYIRKQAELNAVEEAKRRDLYDDEIKLTEEQRSVNQPNTDGSRHRDWTAPKDMPDWQAKLTCAGAMCGASLRYGVGYCRCTEVVKAASGVPPHRCLAHGGRFTLDRPKLNIPGVKSNRHFLYHGVLLPGEEALVESMELDKLDDEILLVRVRLQRAMASESRAVEIEAQGGTVGLRITSTKTTSGGEGGDRYEEVLSRPDHRRIVNETIKSLRDLETIRMQMRQFTQLADNSASINIYIPSNGRGPDE